jgi:N-acetylglucosaminyldiphosphoundecaprenol N-acetyl-beta-D-mannosaminyltransferase
MAPVDAQRLLAPKVTAPEMPRVRLLGLEFAALSEEQTINHIITEASEGRGGWLCTVNLDIMRQSWRSAELRKLVSDADLVVADGMPLIWASAVQGQPLPERVAGSSMTISLTAAAARASASVFLLGGNPGAADGAAQTLRQISPELRIAGTLCPPFGFESDRNAIDWITRRVVSSRPDIVYVGLGFPKQEQLIVALREHLPQAWFMPCGISFSFLSGEIRRASPTLQRLGFEWLHRLVQEPRRLGKRYLLHDTPFMVTLLSQSWRARGAPARPN